MKSGEISDELRKFVLTSIPSIPFLESLLLLRQEPARVWTAQELSQRIFTAPARASDLLTQLQTSGMARPHEGGYCYAAVGDLDQRIGRLAELYRTNLLLVTELVHSGVDRRAFQFADAFKLRRD